VLIIENGTRPDERRTPATLATLEAAVAAVTGPALLIVGEVAALYTSDDAAAGVIEQAQKTIMGMNA
jgi:siroheme synthase